VRSGGARLSLLGQEAIDVSRHELIARDFARLESTSFNREQPVRDTRRLQHADSESFLESPRVARLGFRKGVPPGGYIAMEEIEFTPMPQRIGRDVVDLRVGKF